MVYYDMQDEVYHDVLCGCGWGLTACPESEVPNYCPMCGFDFWAYANAWECI